MSGRETSIGPKGGRRERGRPLLPSHSLLQQRGGSGGILLSIDNYPIERLALRSPLQKISHEGPPPREIEIPTFQQFGISVSNAHCFSPWKDVAPRLCMRTAYCYF